MFIAHAIQKAIGCGCTISCGEVLLALEDAATKEEAIRHLKCFVIGEWDEEEQVFDNRCEELRSLVLFEVSKREEMPINDWYKEAEDYGKMQKDTL